MDVFIAEEAEAGLRADAPGVASEGRRGLLLGHRRGPRYFVARVFPLGGRPFPDASRFRKLNRLFGGTVIGFYADRDPDRGPEGILQPFAYGKVFLLVSGSGIRSRRLAIKPSVIEYDKKFYLSPISLARRRS
jgi:hypothetical protein